MTPTDYVAPMQIETASTQDTTAADELEWLALEAQHVRDPRTGMLYPPPSRVSRGVSTWTGCRPEQTGPAVHPRAYKIKGASRAAVPARAKSPLQAELALAGTSTRYTPPQLGPWERYTVRAAQMYPRVRHFTYDYRRQDWR